MLLPAIRQCIRMTLAGMLAFGCPELEARTWKEAGTGRQIEADLVASDGVSVVVATRDGRRFTLPLQRLSAEDQAFVRAAKEQPPGAGTPQGPGQAGEDRFDDMPKLDAGKIPAAGEAHKALAAVDDAIKKFMAEKGIGAVTIAVSRGGRILHDRAFGWADASLKKTLEPGVKMRVASMVKPVVSATIHTLVTNGKLTLDDRVFRVLKLEEYSESKSCDPRFKEVTIQQLLEHKGGWDRGKSGDLTNRSDKITEMFRIKLDEVEPAHIVRYGLTLPMDFDPGERYAYCNYGYIMLARVIEQESGRKFMECVRETVGRKSAASSFSMSASDARDRQAGETWYCYHPDIQQKEIPLSFRTEARDGAGALACTAADYCRFLETYWISGLPRTSGSYRYSFNGSHPGVTAVCSQRLDGINYAIMANRRGGGKTDWNTELRTVVDAALEPVADKL